MYYDVLIRDVGSFLGDSFRVFSKVETFEKVKCICKKEINSVYCFVYVRKVEIGMTTKWKLIVRLSDYFSNLNKITSDVSNELLNQMFERFLDAK